MKRKNHLDYPKILLILFAFLWVILAIDPVDRADWALENVLIFISVPLIIWTHNRIRLSNFSCTMLFLFLTMHIIGAHYTYSQTPFFSSFNGTKFDRDYYDRLTHFSFGLLLYAPIMEVVSKLAKIKGILLYIFPLSLIVALAGIYEVFEWQAGIIVSPKTAISFIGMQGDIFDTQKDIALAFQGALIAVFINLMKNLKYSRAKPLSHAHTN